MSEKEQDWELVGKAINLLSEHFDSVQIFATRYDGSEATTTNIDRGIGNWFARYGQVGRWHRMHIERDIREDSKQDDA